MDRATSLRFSALDVTKPVDDTSGAVLEITIHHTGVANEREKSEVYSRVLRTLSPDISLCFNLPVDVVLPPELAKYAPVIHGVTPETIQLNGDTCFKFVVRCASATALDKVHEAASKIEWQRSLVQVRRRLAFVKNVVELRFVISPDVEYTNDHLWAKLKGVVDQLSKDGHNCSLLQLQQPLAIVQGTYLVARGNYSAIVKFDNDELFKDEGPDFGKSSRRGSTFEGDSPKLRPFDTTFEAEASCRRYGFVGHVDNCVQKPVQRQQAAHNNNNNNQRL